MRILKHPILPLWCREDGAICMPPCRRFPKFRWTFGCPDKRGYLQIRFHGKQYRVHQLICQTFHGPAPADKPTCDHISRDKQDNRPSNLRWADYKTQENNRQVCEDSLANYGVRTVEDRRVYHREWWEKQKALGKRQRTCPDGKRRYLTDEEFSAMFS